MPERRLGRFTLNNHFIEEAKNGYGYNLFKDMCVLKTEDDFLTNSRHFFANHPDFDHVPEGNIVPEYCAIFTDDSPYPKWVKGDI